MIEIKPVRSLPDTAATFPMHGSTEDRVQSKGSKLNRSAALKNQVAFESCASFGAAMPLLKPVSCTIL